MTILAQIVDLTAQILFWIVFASVILSYFMDPYHPVRRGLDNIVEPMLTPIRRVLPQVGMFDFSPMILLIAINLVSRFIIAILLSLR